jgi:hypothetical protein
VRYELRNAQLVFMYGPFVEVVDTTIHPTDCPCVICVPREPVIRAPYDELYLKQKLSQEI